MAMAMSQQQAWGKKKIGSWADESEAAEAESGGAPPVPEDAFPSLTQAAAKPKKKTKGQTLTLAEFTTGQYIGPGAKRTSLNTANIFTSDDRLTTEEKMYLPTGPKERSSEELHEQRLGGGFRGYGGGFRGDRDQGYHHQRHPRDERDVPMSMPPPPSRADDSSDWSSGKTERSEYRGGGGGGGGYENRRYGGDREYGPSKADEVESWTSGKKSVLEPSQNSDVPRRSRSEMVDRWSSKDSGSEDKWGRQPDEPLQRRRLNLQPRTLPVDQQSADSRPSSSHSSRPGTPGEVQSQTDVAPKPRTNPFGSAKPRELVLEERGQDWRKLDSELELKRYETEAERKLKEEIKSLKSSAGADDPDTVQLIQLREEQLLALELETKARLSEPAPRQQHPRRTPDNFRPPSSHESRSRPPSSHENRSRPPSSHDSWSRPPSAHDNRSSRPPSSQGRENWRRPLHENEGSWRKDRAGGDYGYNRPMTPDMWRRDQDHRPATPNFSTGENEYGRADMWSRPRTPSDEWNSGRRSNNNYSAMSRW